MLLKTFEYFSGFSNMTDLELVNLYIDKCFDFIDPRIFQEIRNRGLYDIINYLPKVSKDEARAVAYTRMIKAGKAFNDPRLDIINGLLKKIDIAKKKLQTIETSELQTIIEISYEMQYDANRIINYFKERNEKEIESDPKKFFN